ncbi:MAG: hypothetical protein KME17_29605 [Cyanosarcina radialis HA8281-LM2]|nr:hypothetical protein [Cyanosarcina radialis HA8281-LM2]
MDRGAASIALTFSTNPSQLQARMLYKSSKVLLSHPKFTNLVLHIYQRSLDRGASSAQICRSPSY